MDSQASKQQSQPGINKANQQPEVAITGNDAFYQFDKLPAAAHVRITVVMMLFACSKATVWRWVKKSILPEPIKRGGIAAWNVEELREALNKLPQ